MDYALRDSIQFGTLSLSQARAIYQDFSAYKGEFVCSTTESARILSTAYMVCLSPVTQSLVSLADRVLCDGC